VRWSVPLIGYVAVAFQNHRGFVLLGAGIVLIAIAALTMVSGPRRGDTERPPPVPSLVPGMGQEGTQ